MRTVVVLLLTGLIAVLASAEGRAADPSRIALVIGNSKYPDNEFVLTDAANDTQYIADELKRDGFAVDRQNNLTGDGMRQALDRFYARITPGSIALIFFDGFGIQSNRQTYLLPVDAQVWTEPDISRDGFGLEAILGEMNSRGAGIKIAIIDAARRNPFERRFRRYSAGLAPVITPNNSIVIYSTALGSVVSTAKNDRSLFVTELLREIRTPNVSAEQALTNTKNGVVRATNQEQVPWLTSSLTSEFSFAALSTRPPDSKPAEQTQQKQEPQKQEPQTQEPQKQEPQTQVCEAPKPDSPPGADDLARDPVIADLTRKIAANAKDANARYKRGQVYAIKHAYPQAMADFDAVIKLNPKDAEALNNRCWTRAATGDLQVALADCNQALQLNPGLTDALDSRGLVNLKLGKTAEAIKDYSDAIQRNPRSSPSLFGRGVATRKSGGDGTADIALAKSMDPNIAREFAGYGVTECVP